MVAVTDPEKTSSWKLHFVHDVGVREIKVFRRRVAHQYNLVAAHSSHEPVRRPWAFFTAPRGNKAIQVS